ncbi:MAG: hypothetical protein JKY37_19250 [Nannocystaceae bacterium]|nr:hypothetical protein [Nannocystaceae bacterium]
MAPKRALAIGAACGVVAAAANAWVLWRWLGFGFWFLALVVPLCLVSLQGTAAFVAKLLIGVERRDGGNGSN